jgi:hypothetical protein
VSFMNADSDIAVVGHLSLNGSQDRCTRIGMNLGSVARPTADLTIPSSVQF